MMARKKAAMRERAPRGRSPIDMLAELRVRLREIADLRAAGVF